MDFYEVLEKRRTIRDFSDREVTDEMLEKDSVGSFQGSDQRPSAPVRVRRGARPRKHSEGNCAARKEHGEVQETRFRSGRIRRQGQNGDVRRRTAQTAKDAHGERIARHPVLSPTDMAIGSHLRSRARSTTSLRHGARWRTSCLPPLRKVWEPCSIFLWETKPAR